MKKYLLTCLALVALFSCKKETPTPSKGVITLSTPAAVTLTSKDTVVNVQFKSTAKWTAATTAAEDVAMISPKSGDAAQTATVNVAVSENTGEAARSFDLTLTPEGGDPVKVTFTQAAKAAVPYFGMVKPQTEVTEVPVGGGEYDIEVETNTDFDYEDYSGEGKAFPWQKLTPANDGKSFKLKIAANTGFDPRQSYVKFTVPAIQDPVYDENGDPTGETTDHTVRVYFNQAGTATVVSGPIPEALANGATRFSMAMFGRDMLISNGAGVFLGSNADNSVTKIIPREDLPFTPTGITNDDAGNVVISIGGKTSCDVADSTLILAYVPKDADASQLATSIKTFGKYRNQYYGYGLDNLRVRGDVESSSCIVLSSGGGWDGGSYGVAWDFDGPGQAFDPANIPDLAAPKGMNLPANAVWSSNEHLVTYPFGTSSSEGFLYIGYAYGNANEEYGPISEVFYPYDLYYNATAGESSNNWTSVFATGAEGNEGFNAMDIIDVEGNKLCAFVAMSYFPQWGSSWLFILNVTDPANVQLLSKHPLPIGTATSSLTTDVILIPEATALVAFVIDGGTGMMSKVTYPEPEL